jgi:hypothetical protein
MKCFGAAQALFSTPGHDGCMAQASNPKEKKMRFNRTTLTAVTAVALAGIGAGSALAATGTGTTTKADRSAAAITALAGKLGISSDTLSAALKATAKDRVAAELAAGTITRAQADAANARIDAGAARLGGFGGPGDRGFGRLGFGGPGGALGDPLATAATFLGVTEASLHTSLDAGKTLAAVAVEKGKTAAGLEAALVADAKATIAKSTTLTDAQKTQILATVEARTKALVENGAPAGGHGMRGGHGMGGGYGMRGGFGVDSLPVTPTA